MTWTIWLSFATISAANIITPGPANLNTLRRALQLGFVPVLPTIFGNALGLAVGGLLCASGVTSFVLSSDIFWVLFRSFGLAYLGWLGLKLIFKHEEISFKTESTPSISPYLLFKEAFFLAATNPKALLFYVALFPQVLNPNEELLAQSMFLVLTYCGLSILSLSTYAATANCFRDRFLTQARYDVFRMLSGVVLLVFALMLYLQS